VDSVDTSSNSEIVCHECALLVDIPLLAEHQKASCPRCGFVLTARFRNAIERILAFSFTAIIFLFLSFPFEFLAFKTNGLERKIDIMASFTILIDNSYAMLALLELITIFIIPLLILVGLIYLLYYLRRNIYPVGGQWVFNAIYKILPWSMVEIFVVGVLVSLIKIVSLADIRLGPSFFAYILFSISMTAVVLHMDKNHLIELLTRAKNNSHMPQPVEAKVLSEQASSEAGLKYHQLSIHKTWALLVTSIVFYIPANMLPIMNTRWLGQDDPSTILGGVILLWQMGSYPIAAIIFIASVAVPVAKILVLAWLNYSVQRQHQEFVKERMTLYRLAEFVGRWSMVDVYVVIILVSLVQLGNTMSIFPGGAALAFSGMVIATMFAAMSFEPQLIWRNKNNDNSEVTNAK